MNFGNISLKITEVFPGGLDGKESACQCRKQEKYGLAPWVRKIPCRRKWQPAPVFLPGKFHGERSLMGYSPWGHEESDTTEQAHYVLCTETS